MVRDREVLTELSGTHTRNSTDLTDECLTLCNGRVCVCVCSTDDSAAG